MKFTEGFPKNTNKGLRLAFKMINRRYFHNKIGEWKVSYGKLSDMGVCYSDEILISRELKDCKLWSAAVLTLFHECVHAYLYKYPKRDRSKDGFHGKAFEDEMLRLANAGAFKGLW